MSKQNNIPKLRFKGFEGEWELKKVGELCNSIVPGRNKPTNFGGDIPWITTPDIEHNGIINYSKKGLNISREEAKKVGSKIVPINSIIISCVGELGLSAIAGREIIINQQLHAFIPKDKIEYRFLLYQLNLKKKYMDKVATKTAVPYMNKDNCNSIPIDFPTLPEQEKIASFLSAVDEKIQQLTRKAALVEQYKKGVMQQLFSGKLRFKDENGEEYADWEEKKLGDVVKYVKGFAFKSKDYQDSGIRIVRVSDLLSSSIKDDNEKVYISSEKANLYEKYKLKKGNIIITTVGSKPDMIESAVGRGIYIKNENEGLLNQNMLKFENVEGLNNRFLIGLLNLKKYQSFLKDIARGNANQANITVVDLLNYKIILPSLPEQQKIAGFLSGIDEKIGVVQGELLKMQGFKKGLLQQMFV